MLSTWSLYRPLGTAGRRHSPPVARSEGTDGPMHDDRRVQFLKLVTDAGFKPEQTFAL